MPQRFGVDEDGMFARGDDIFTMAICRPKKVGGAHYSTHAPVKSARRRLIFAGGGYYPFHPAVTFSSQDTRRSQPWVERLSVHPVQERAPFPFAIAGSRLVNHRTGCELEQHDAAALIVRIGQPTSQIDDRTDRLAAKESVRKNGLVRGQPNEKLDKLLAPLGNQLEPKPGQNREFSEQGKEPLARFLSEKSALGEFCISRLPLKADRSHGRFVACSL